MNARSSAFLFSLCVAPLIASAAVGAPTSRDESRAVEIPAFATPPAMRKLDPEKTRCTPIRRIWVCEKPIH